MIQAEPSAGWTGLQTPDHRPRLVESLLVSFSSPQSRSRGLVKLPLPVRKNLVVTRTEFYRGQSPDMRTHAEMRPSGAAVANGQPEGFKSSINEAGKFVLQGAGLAGEGRAQ